MVMLFVGAVERPHGSGISLQDDDIAIFQMVGFPEAVNIGKTRDTVQFIVGEERPIP
jgi:hypothetical protein